MEAIKLFVLWNSPVNQWWLNSLLGQVSGFLQSWGYSSWLIQWLDVIGLGLATLYLSFATQSNTTPLGLLLLAMVPILGLQWGFRSLPISPIHLAVGLWWIIAVVATVFSPVPYEALSGLIKFTLYLLGFCLWHQSLQKPAYRSWVVGAVLLGSLWMGIYGLRQYFYGAEELATWVDPESGLSGTTRIYSYHLNPNLYGGYLVSVIPLGLVAAWYWQTWGLKMLALFISGVNLLCLLLTYSRGAWIGGVAALSVVSLLLVQWVNIFLPVRWRRWSLPALIVGGLLVFGLGMLTLEPLRLRVLSIFVGRGDTSNNFRINVWQAVIDMIQAFPVLGIGPGNDAFNRVYPLFQRPNYSALSAYSIVLEVAVETGFVGLAAFLWSLVLLSVHGLKHWLVLAKARHAEGLWLVAGLGTCAGIMAHGLVDTVWYRPQIQMQWWLGVALVSSVIASYPLHLPDEPKDGNPK